MKKRRAHLDDFHKLENGGYAYTGNTYSWEEGNNKSQRKNTLIKIWVFLAVILISFMVSGIIPNPWMNVVYTLIPYIISIISLIAIIYKTSRFTASGNTLREYIYEKTFKSIPKIIIFDIVMAILAVVGEIIAYFISGISDDFILSLPFVIPLIVGIISLFILYHFFINIRINKN